MQYRRGVRAARPPAEEQTPDWLAAQTSDDEFWLLAVAAKYGLRRQLHDARRGGTANSLWLGQTPIDYYDSKWFYDLAQQAIARGLLDPSEKAHRLTPEAERALLVGQKSGRVPKQPADLIGATTGKAEGFPVG